jgi:hypothetical protein
MSLLRISRVFANCPEAGLCVRVVLHRLIRRGSSQQFDLNLLAVALSLPRLFREVTQLSRFRFSAEPFAMYINFGKLSYRRILLKSYCILI